MSRTVEARERAALGLLVVLLRSLRRWTQEELAAASGAQRSQISRYELWRTAPSEDTLRRLAAAARVPWGEARRMLPALRALVRLAAGEAGPWEALPGGRDLPAAVGRAAAGAFRERVLPFLREHLPILSGLEEAGPEPPPEGDADRVALGLLIVLLRSLRHWSQEELAAASGTLRSQVSAWELGKRAPRRKSLERLAAAAAVPLEAALNGLPFLRDLVRAAWGRPGQPAGLADRIGRTAEDLLRLEMPCG